MNWRARQRGIVVGVLALALPLTATPALSSTSSGGFLVGAYYGNQGWNMDQVRALEAWQGRRHAVVNLFTNWDGSIKTKNNLFNQQLPNIWGNGNVPLITWEPFTGKNTPADIERRIASGSYDAYVTDWAARLKRFLDGPDAVSGTADDRRAYLRLGHEMNGDWYPWGAAVGANSPADFVGMWRRVHATFDAAGLGPTRLGWIWSVNHEDVGGFPAEAFFPGDDVVDWVAVDGYNWGVSQSWSSWRSPSDVLGAMVGRVRAISVRPLALTETASSSATGSGSDLAAKSQWVTDLFGYAVVAQARMVVWFNADKETDWATFGGSGGDGTFRFGRTSYRTLAAYKAAVNRSEAVSPVAGNPRILTDAQFAGNLP
jgi:hypothetical protein